MKKKLSLSNYVLHPPSQKPFMWAPKNEGEEQKKHFNILKLKPMSIKAGQQNSLLNSKVFLGNFWGMIKYFDLKYTTDFAFLHVYFGINHNKEIVFIFAPAKSEERSSEILYHYLSQDFDPKNPKNSELSKDDMLLWTAKFVKAMALDTIDITDPDNQFPDPNDPNKEASDTRYAIYYADDIGELMAVKDYYVSQGHNINNSLNGYLGSYLQNGAPRGEFKGRYKNRIVCQFELLDGNNNDFFLDSISEFMGIKTIGASNYRQVVDNGQLCPTNCPR